MATEQPAGVDFFERQHAARGTSVKLVALFALAVLGVVAAIDLVVFAFTGTGTTSARIGWVVTATVVTLLLIGGGSLTKMATLRGGGSAVALSVGGIPVDPTTSDPQLRRFVHVVEEMSIASGVPMPKLFVMPHEDGINAFAAGFTPSDAAITVTAGALQRLNRDELQGVVGHEFSHILNGDMRLNVQLMGLLAGLLVIGLVGLRILQFGGLGGRRDKNAGAIVLIGLAALVLGFVGQFFAGLIKAAVSRQREWLADASSVQFTRQTAGLSGALKKIAGVEEGSALRNQVSERQINHMLFGEGGRSIAQLWATHPPLLERIQALEPGFRPEEVEALRAHYRAAPPIGLAEDQQLGLVDAAVSMPRAVGPAAQAPAPAAPQPGSLAVEASSLAARVGTITTADLERGAALSRAIPPRLRELATQPTTAAPLVLALLLDRDDAVRARQLQTISDRLAPQAATATEAIRPELDGLAPLLRTPLVGIALPALTTRPRAQLATLLDVVDALVSADGLCTVFEYCLTRLVGSYVRDSLDPARRARSGRTTVAQLQGAALTLLTVVAVEGNPDRGAQEHAFVAGVARLGLPAQAFTPPQDVFAALDAVWTPLDGLDPRHKRPLIEALVTAIADDGMLAVAEAELLRTACALLHCPLPSLLG